MEINNNKFKILNESLEAIKDNDINILTLCGSPGTGKTHTTLEYLKEKDINYTYVNSYATPLSFYEILYNSRNKDVVIFDDLHGVNNPLILAMLKAACWTSDGAKVVSYYSTSSKMDLLDLPESFEFGARVILIFNKMIQGYEPITNRGITIGFNFNFEEKVKIFEDLGDVINEDVLKYVKENCNDATENLSIRSLVILSTLKDSGKDFVSFAKNCVLKQNEDKRLLMELSCHEWISSTGMSRRSYFRHKNKYGLKEKSAKVPHGID